METAKALIPVFGDCDEQQTQFLLPACTFLLAPTVETVQETQWRLYRLVLPAL